MKTYSDVKAAIDKLQARAEELRQAEKAGVVSRIREAISVYGITAADLGLAAGGARSAARSSVAAPAPKGQVGVAKYRDPASGKTWTGRGKPPLWIAGAKDRQAFLIDAGSSAAPGAADGRTGGRKAQAGRPS
jgi:DNA-binding protein H-NS